MARKTGVIGIALAMALGLAAPHASAQTTGWVAAWGASQQSQGEAKLSNASVRLIARVTLPGDAVRIDRKSTRLNSSHT